MQADTVTMFEVHMLPVDSFADGLQHQLALTSPGYVQATRMLVPAEHLSGFLVGDFVCLSLEKATAVQVDEARSKMLEAAQEQLNLHQRSRDLESAMLDAARSQREMANHIKRQ